MTLILTRLGATKEKYSSISFLRSNRNYFLHSIAPMTQGTPPAFCRVFLISAGWVDTKALSSLQSMRKRPNLAIYMRPESHMPESTSSKQRINDDETFILRQ